MVDVLIPCRFHQHCAGPCWQIPDLSTRQCQLMTSSMRYREIIQTLLRVRTRSAALLVYESLWSVAGRKMEDGRGRLADGTVYEQTSGEELGKDGYWFRWTCLRGISPRGKVSPSETCPAFLHGYFLRMFYQARGHLQCGGQESRVGLLMNLTMSECSLDNYRRC